MKKFFDLKLYAEGIRSLKIFGIITTVIMSLYSLFYTATMIIENTYYGMQQAEFTSLVFMNPLLVGLFCIVAPLMTVMIFHFTANRAASDYYFAIPQTRGCIFLSLFSAVMSWVVFSALVSSLAPIILALFFPKWIIINYLASAIFLLESLVGAFFVAAAVTIAVGVTGTPISTVVVSLMIIFLPRVFLMVISNVGLSNLPIVGETISAIPMLSYKTQIPFAFVLSIPFEGFYTKPSLGAFIYTFVLGVIYLILGYVIFQRRASEASGKTAATKSLRAAFRICLAGGVGLLVPALIFASLFQNEDTFVIVITCVAFSILTFVVYCCYELISTKSLKATAKAIPGFVAVIAIELVAFLMMHGIRGAVTNYTPKPQEIDGIYISANNYKDYWSAKTEKVFIDNTEAKVIVSEALSENLKYCTIDGEPHAYYSKYYNDENGSYIQWSVSIVSGGIKHNRYISIDTANSERLIEVLESVPDYKKVYTEFPSADDKSTAINIWDVANLSQKRTKEIYSAYLRDLKKGNIGFEEIYSAVNNGYASDTYFEINVSTIVGTENYDFYLPVTPACEETLSEFYKELEKFNSHSKGRSLEFVEKLNGDYKGEFFVDLSFYGFNEQFNIEPDEEWIEILKSCETKNFRKGDKIAKLHVSGFDEEKSAEIIYIDYYKLNEKALEKHNVIYE